MKRMGIVFNCNLLMFGSLWTVLLLVVSGCVTIPETDEIAPYLSLEITGPGIERPSGAVRPVGSSGQFNRSFRVNSLPRQNWGESWWNAQAMQPGQVYRLMALAKDSGGVQQLVLAIPREFEIMRTHTPGASVVRSISYKNEIHLTSSFDEPQETLVLTVEVRAPRINQAYSRFGSEVRGMDFGGTRAWREPSRFGDPEFSPSLFNQSSMHVTLPVGTPP